MPGWFLFGEADPREIGKWIAALFGAFLGLLLTLTPKKRRR
jgi:hypothetical protein